MRLQPHLILFALVAVLWSSPAHAGDLPDLALTPGIARTDMTVAQMCARKWGKDARHVTDAMKAQVYAEYGIEVPKINGRYQFPRAPGGKSAYEIDHLISRELLGADDIKNLWPESYISQPWNAHLKDRLENRLHREVCAGRLSLRDAQDMISEDWITAYKRYFPEAAHR